MAGPNPECEPELGNYKTTIEVREAENDSENTSYKATWRGLTAYGMTLPQALDNLSARIKEQG